MALRLTGMVPLELAKLRPDEGPEAPTACVKLKAEVISLFPVLRREESSASQDPSSTEGLWRDRLDDWDNTRTKKYPNWPGFEQPEIGEAFRIDTRFTPLWVQAKLNFLQEAKAGRSLASGLESNNTEATVDSLWQNYFKDPNDWWDNRRRKLQSKSPDFRNKRTKQALWIENRNTPKWVRAALKWRTSTKGVSESSKKFYGEGIHENTGDLTSYQSRENSWTALIRQHTKCGKGRQALKMYEEMRKVGVEPTSRTFVALLQACSSLQDLESAKRIHADVVRSGLESDMYVGTTLVDAYAKCRSLVDARDIFENMPCRDVVSWTAMILGYAQMDEGDEALQLYSRMRQEGVVPSDRAYIGALKACSSIAELVERKKVAGTAVRGRCLETVRTIHSEIVKGKLESGVFLATMLVDAYAKCASLDEARQVFEKMPQRSVVSWNAMILGCAQLNRGEEALQLYTRMQQEGMVPDDRTYVSALKACSSLLETEERYAGEATALRQRCLETVREIHSNIVEGKLQSDVFVGNMLVDVYSKCGSLDSARCVFEEMPHRDVVSWNAMIWGYAQMHKGEEAVQLYTRMQSGAVVPNDRTYVSVLKACSTLLVSDDCLGGDLRSVQGRCLETVRAIHADVRKGNFESDVYVGNILVDVYAKCGSLEDAMSVFENMPHRTVVSWTAMIFGHVQMDEGEVALHLYSRMQQEGVVPNYLTYVGALNACGSLAGLEKGREIHAQVAKAGLDSMDSCVTHSLIDMYGKCGSMVEALRVFDAMPGRTNCVAWNAMIAGYAHLGESKHAFDLFQRMKQEGIQPDGITFLAVLIACSHVGLVDKGDMYFKSMSKDHGITPNIKHFTCVVDLLGRSGQLDRAMETVKAIPFQPDSAVWECVLGACRKWGNVELGRHAFDCALRLKKNDAAPYVLMSNIYAAAHLRDEAKGIQVMRMQSRAWKQPGRSRWTDLGGVAHVFVVGDQRHPESRDIYAKLATLLIQMKKEGYVPHLDSVLRDIPDEEKEDALCGHSERLAIGYALLKTPEGTTIRVVKNLRVCEDCHKATALISRIEQRTIICRDTSRFHVFKEGKCSCGDYW